MEINELISRTKTAQKTGQIVTVIPNGHHLEGHPDVPLYDVRLFTFGDGQWREDLAVFDGRAGRGGLSEHRKNGDGSTPIGAFPLVYAFGNAAACASLKIPMKFKAITPRSYWGGDDWGRYSNRWYEGDSPLGKDYEHLADCENKQYKYAMVIGFNYDDFKPGIGNAIFFHCCTDSNTAGCVAINETDMSEFMEHVRDGAYMIIVSKAEDLLRY